ncbi:MAG: histidine phosphatase family protein [Alphaproteobacteria bacterium]
MTRLAFIRHGLTDWNVERRMQGRRDIPLNDDGRAMVAAWRLPSDFLGELAGLPIVASTLVRCRETADILKANNPGLGPITYDERLVEKHWGIWEGRNLHEMEAKLGDDAHLGDHRPEGGESRLDMLPRVADALAELATDPAPRIVVTHRGVIRTVYALATGWNLTGETPDEMSRRKAQIFHASPDGSAEIDALNVSLAAPTQGTGK